MKAADFDYVRPDTLEAALGHLADQTVETRAIAGGQSLMAMMNFRLAQPERLVDLAAILMKFKESTVTNPESPMLSISNIMFVP